MLSVIGFILTIGILVFIHEFGHYCAARFFQVKVEEFAIGFGKELFGITDKRGVRWKICALPFGGYVKIYGYDREAFKKGEIIDNAVAFFTKSCFARFCIVAAGPIINYLLAIIIFSGFYFIAGKIEIPPIIGEVVLSSPAEKAGLREGDKIVRINNKKIDNFADIQNIILINLDQPLNLLVKRGSELISFPIVPGICYSEKTKIGCIGVGAKENPVHKKMGLFASIGSSVKLVIDVSVLTAKSLSQMIIGKRSFDSIGGPLTIATESGKSLSQGCVDFILFIAMLSINLGLVNFLPIPLLDGGHLVLILYESISGTPPTQKIKDLLLRLGMVIIIFLIVISLSNDIKNLL